VSVGNAPRATAILASEADGPSQGRKEEATTCLGLGVKKTESNPPPPMVRPTHPPPFFDLEPPHISHPPPQLPELAGVAVDPLSGEDATTRSRTEPPLRPVVVPPPP
jgi:hypothetical protein